MVDGLDGHSDGSITIFLPLDLIAGSLRLLKGSKNARPERLEMIEPLGIWLNDGKFGCFDFAVGNPLDKFGFILVGT